MPARNNSLINAPDALKRKALQTQIEVGSDALERGEFIEIEDGDLGAYLEALTSRAGNVMA